tara:strand:+ start:1780 stop:1992 length:213 start_codon:yes stop_codon:yes gene_type:complete
MQKFNGFENYFIKASINEAVKKAESDIISLEGEGKRSIYAQGYFTMIGNELLNKIDSMTLKSALKDGKNK